MDDPIPEMLLTPNLKPRVSRRMASTGRAMTVALGAAGRASDELGFTGLERRAM